MILGALLDSGFELEKLRLGLASLALQGYQLSAARVLRGAIAATKFDVTLEASQPQPARGLREILELIENSRLSASVKKKSSEIFRHLGEVEAGIHGVPLETVHFHELGGVDSIVDIVGCVFVLDALKIERCYASALPLGSGKIKTVLQIVAILLFIVKDSATFASLSSPMQLWIQATAWTVMGAAVVMTIMSMVDYFIHAGDALIGPWSGAASLADAEKLAMETAAEETDETIG